MNSTPFTKIRVDKVPLPQLIRRKRIDTITEAGALYFTIKADDGPRFGSTTLPDKPKSASAS